MTGASARRQSTADYRTELSNSIDDVDIAAWNAVRPVDDLYNDPRLLKAFEISMSGSTKFRYLLIRDENDAPVAISPLFTAVVDGTVLVNRPFLARCFRLAGKIAPFITRYRMLFCGMPFSGAQHHLRIHSDADLPRVLDVLDRRLCEIAREDKAKYISLKEFDVDAAKRLKSLTRLGYHRGDSLPMNVMSIPPGDHDAYLKQLPKRKRHDIRRLARKLSSAQMTFVTTSDPAVVQRYLSDRVHQYYLDVVSRSQTVFEILPPELFREIARQIPDNSEFTFCLDEQENVHAFTISLFFGKTYHYLFCGIDYEANRKGEIYFNLMHRMVEDAIRRGKTLALVGQNADECKYQKLGTHQESRHVYVKGVGILSRCMLKYFSEILFPPRELKYPPSSPVDGQLGEEANDRESGSRKGSTADSLDESPRANRDHSDINSRSESLTV